MKAIRRIRVKEACSKITLAQLAQELAKELGMAGDGLEIEITHLDY